MQIFRKRMSNLTFPERLVHVSITFGVPLSCIDFFSLRGDFGLLSVILVVAGNVVGVVALALIEHSFYRVMRKS